jgi:very-short-patch-repair endonuclease
MTQPRLPSPTQCLSDAASAITRQARRICQQGLAVPPELISLARLIQQDTSLSAQQRLWECLKGGQLLGYLFTSDIDLGTFTADFYCEAAHLVVEIGDDTSRLNRCPACDCWARSNGFRIVRLHHREIESNLEQVLNVLILMLQLAASDCRENSQTPL